MLQVNIKFNTLSNNKDILVLANHCYTYKLKQHLCQHIIAHIKHNVMTNPSISIPTQY
ncbi:hypothetical protein CRENPOLYSF1_1260022 [Crenothrix polyspora]|uniref:Uncharacterized protein n=1 Tax=Crenothrix polyspora TaxID=360316 RepID=A0A1R4H279_9GAMM|nr:hypothetical protein CRENPOLYSF1_1260022 [Crenothrix polyspora]